MPSQLSNRRFWVLSSAVVFLAALVAAWRFFDFVVDDTAIRYRYADRILDGKGFTWTDGERVEGVSEHLSILLHVLGLLLGIDDVVFTRIVGLIGAVMCGTAVQFLALRRKIPRHIAVTLGSLVAMLAPIALWVGGGIDVPMFSGLVAWVVVLAVTHLEEPDRNYLRAGSLVGVLLVLSRVDGVMLLTMAALGVFLLSPARRLRSALRLAAPGFVVTAVVTAMRYWWFGKWTSNTAANKLKTSIDAVQTGLGYVASGLWWMSPLLLAVAAVAFALRPAPRRRLRDSNAAVPVLVMCAWVPYIVAIAGDWMPGYRHLAVVSVLVTLTAVCLVPPTRVVLASSVIILGLASSVTMSQMSEEVTRVTRLKDAYTSCLQVSEVLKAAFSGLDPLMAVEPAGCVPWRTGFDGVDMLGLLDAHVAGKQSDLPVVSWTEWERRWRGPGLPPTDVVMVGHEHGDGRYIWEREPDLFMLCNGWYRGQQGCFRSWLYIKENYDVPARYVEIQLADAASPTGSSWMWVRHDGGSTGARIDRNLVQIPAYLLATTTDAIVASREGQAVVTLRAGSTRSPVLRLSAGRWRLRGLPEGVQVRVSSSCATVVNEQVPVVHSSTDGCPVSILLDSGRVVELDDLVLRRA